MKFLLTNDDGIEAQGLVALKRATEPLGTAVVVAPDRHLSGCSHQATTQRPLALAEWSAGWYTLDGSPVDCTRIGLTRAAPQAQWVISGVNEGGNLGADIFLSGTVAAAREACLLGKPAIAVSQYVRRKPIDWERAAKWAMAVIEMLLAQPPEPGAFWNVNLPDPDESLRDLPQCVFCAVDPHALPVDYELREGKLYYRARYHDRQRLPGHDVDVCFAGHIAISQIRLHAISSPPAGSH
ncbi:MAG: 5'/3'-nucleotidase SurE [Pirellulales bacterium]